MVARLDCAYDNFPLSNPLTSQMTDVPGDPATLTEKVKLVPVCTEATVGEMLTVPGGTVPLAEMVTRADADTFESAVETAEIVTAAGLRTCAGAV